MTELDSVLVKIGSGFVVSLLGMAVKSLFAVARDVRELKYQSKEIFRQNEELDQRLDNLEKVPSSRQ